MKKLCCIFDEPTHYRELIYKRIEDSYACDWYFEDLIGQIRTFDTSQFKRVSALSRTKFKNFYFVKGLISLLWNKEYEDYLMLGSTRNVSLFVFLILKKFIFPKKKAFLWTHGFYGKETKMEIIWKRNLLRMADGLFLYGNYARKLMIEDGFNPDKLHVIHNSLNYDEQFCLRKSIVPLPIYKNHFCNNNPILLFIGRLTRVKQLDLLVESLYSLQQNGEEYNLVFVGDGIMRKSLENLVNQKNLTENVWFYGACYDEKINAELIYNADLCVAPGNIGLTAMHSLMYGCPCISHDKFELQMPECEAILQGVTGSFFKYNDQASLTASISMWFSKMGQKREEVRQACFQEIDTQWNPEYQMNVIKTVI